MIFRPNIFPEKDETTDKWIMDCQVTDRFSDLSEDPPKSPIMKIEGRDDISLKALFSSSSSFFNRTNTLEEFEASSAPENIEERSERLPSGHNSPVPHKQINQVAKRPRSASTRSRRSSSKKKMDKTEHETRASISGYISRKIRPDSIWLNPILPTPFREAGIVWNGVYKRKPSLVFSPSVMVTRDTFVKILVEKLNMSCKVSKNDCKLLRTLLYSHGLTEMQGYSNEFNLLWTSSHLKPSQLKCLYEFQKINHFPNSFELTRKDRLATNIQRMQILKGFHNFDFVPRTFVLPQDYQDLLSEHMKERSVYIVKPIASSRGRGIYLATNPDNISTDETVIVSRYISNPLLIDGFKFDLRLYVAATSYDPLIVYVYEEGLARFATVRYQFGVRHLKNVCMHLTNYSVNKMNHDFVHNDDADVEDFGNKWSLGALLRYLRSEGKDTAGLMLRIEDIIIKSFIAVESPIVSACHLFQAGKNNCFELYGFDIIVDENLRPWLLEVNLSPSLACDTPLDFKIKSSMIADLLTLAGIQCHDPSRKYNAGVSHPAVNPLVPTFVAPKQPTFFVPARNYLLSELPGAVNAIQKRTRTTPTSGNTKSPGVNAQAPSSRESTTASCAAKNSSGPKEISIEECRFVRRLQEESARCGGWLRLFPSPEAWEQYSALFEAGPPFGASSEVPSWLGTSRTTSHPERRSTLRNLHNAEPLVTSAGSVAQHTVYSKHLRIAIAIAAMNRINRSTFINPAAVAGGEEKQGGPAKCPIQTVHPNLTPPHVNLGLYTGLMDAKRSAEPVPEPRLTINLPPSSQVFSTFHAPLHSLPPNILAESLMVVLGYENPNFTVTRVQARRIAACYVHTLGRLPFYHRKLGAQPVTVRGVCLSVNCDHSKKNGGHYCGIRPSEETEYPAPTVKWSAELPISAQIMSLTPSSSTSSPKSSSFQGEEVGNMNPLTPEKENYLLKSDSIRRMTKLQARSTFSTYLSRVYDRLVEEKDVNAEKPKEAEGQLELMLRFLQKAALNLSPFAVATVCCGENVEVNKEVDSLGDFAIPPFGPSATMEEKRKHLVQVLDTFIRIYMYETALACSKLAPDVSAGVDKDSFQKFLQEASESELEAALSEYTKVNKSVSLFIGVSQCNSVCRARNRTAPSSANFSRKLTTPRYGTGGGGGGGGIRKNLSNQSNHNWPKTSAKTKRANGKFRSPLVSCRDDTPVSDRLVAMPMSQNRKMPKNACFAVCPCPVVNTNNKNMPRHPNENMAFVLVRGDTKPGPCPSMGLGMRTDLVRRPSERTERRPEGQRSEPVVLTARSRDNFRTEKRRARLSSRSLPLRIKSGQKLAKLPTLMAEPLTSIESLTKDAGASPRQQREQSTPSSRILSCPLINTSSTTDPLSEVHSSPSGRTWEGSQVQSYRSLGLTSFDSREEQFGRDLLTSGSAESVITGRSLLADVFPYLPNRPSYNLIDLS